MLLWTTIGLFLVGILLSNIGHRFKRLRRVRLDDLGGGMTVIFGFIMIFALAAMAVNYIGVDAEIAKKQQHRDFLVAQYKTGVYDGLALSQYHLLQQIDEWNCTLAEKQKLTHDYWVGIFVPDYYDDLEYITVNLFEDVTTGRE
jgi:hypothetical protein